MADLRIGEVAARAGIAASAIRYYEREGLLPAARRRGGQRVYEDAVLGRLALIDLAKRAGFTVAETKRLLAGFGRRTPPSERWRTLAERKRVQLEERIAEAERMKQVLEVVMGCRCPSLDDCASTIRESHRG